MTPTASGEKFCMEYHEAQYWDFCFSIFCMQYFISLGIMKLLIMQMTLHLIVLKEAISSLLRN